MLREKLLQENVLSENQLFKAPKASDEDLLLAHDEHYVNGLKDNTLSEKELRPIGLPWSEQLLLRSYCAVGGFISATENALQDGFSAMLAGGTHHAHAGSGEGYCIFNDFAVAALKLIKNNHAKKVLIIDLDVHQGNGNSSILGNRDDIFILSLHGERNYPFRKVPSHMDIPLPANTGDTEYLKALEMALGRIDVGDFDIVLYQAGVDNLKEDKLGTFELTFDGLKRRDRMVFEYVKNKPVAMAIGGGYADPIELTVEAHVNTFKEAKAWPWR